MGSEWRETTLGELASEGGTLIQTGTFGSQLHASDYTDKGTPVIMPANLAGNRIDLTGIARIRKEDVDRLSKHVVRAGDIVYSRRGDVTRKALISDSEAGLFCRTGCLLDRPGLNVNPKFLAYHLSAPGNQEWIIRHAIGATMPNLNTGILAAVPLKIPQRDVQDRIANILSSLDSKLALNRQINTTLESMAQALFKSWFVDFDPVIDNALAAGTTIPAELKARAEARAALGDQRKPLPDHIRQQFPDRFVMSDDLGWVPEGWAQSDVGTEFDVTMGQSPPGHTYNGSGEGIPFFQGRADFGFRYPSNRIYCMEPKRYANKGDTLVSVRAPVGDVNMAASNCCIGRGVSASRHKSGSRSFTYYVMLELREYFKVYEAEETVFGSINQKSFKALKHLATPEALVRLFEEQAGSFDERLEITTGETATLTMLRDTLLPKLLSGELRVPEAERQVEEAI